MCIHWQFCGANSDPRFFSHTSFVFVNFGLLCFILSKIRHDLNPSNFLFIYLFFLYSELGKGEFKLKSLIPTGESNSTTNGK
jgi:hypothetical protein